MSILAILFYNQNLCQNNFLSSFYYLLLQEEDNTRGIKKSLGDTNFFDPVSLKEMNVLYPGNPEIAAVYREKCYYFSSAENRDKFIEEPTQFLSLEKPPQVSFVLNVFNIKV